MVSVAAHAHGFAGRARGSGTVVDADLVAHVARTAGGGGDVLGAMLHRPRGDIAGKGDDALLDLQQDLAGIERVVMGHPVVDLVGDAGVGTHVAHGPLAAVAARGTVIGRGGEVAVAEIGRAHV